MQGPAIPNWREIDLATIQARCLVDGEEKWVGTANIVYGGPLKSLLWLANNGSGLRAGEWVSTGTITGLAPVKAGNRVIGDFGRFGTVEVTVGE